MSRLRTFALAVPILAGFGVSNQVQACNSSQGPFIAQCANAGFGVIGLGHFLSNNTFTPPALGPGNPNFTAGATDIWGGGFPGLVAPGTFPPPGEGFTLNELLGMSRPVFNFLGRDGLLLFMGGMSDGTFGLPTAALPQFFSGGPSTFVGGVRIAVGDVDLDGVGDVIVNQGPGGPGVQVFSGGNLLPGGLAYDPSFRGGVYIAAGDLDGDGVGDVIGGQGPGGGPQVNVFPGVGGGPTVLFVGDDRAHVVQSFFVDFLNRGDADSRAVVDTVLPSGAFKIAENESPRPVDRVFFSYNYFSDIAPNPTSPFQVATLSREVVGFEKTFFDDNASIGIRLPFQGQSGVAPPTTTPRVEGDKVGAMFYGVPGSDSAATLDVIKRTDGTLIGVNPDTGQIYGTVKDAGGIKGYRPVGPFGPPAAATNAPTPASTSLRNAIQQANSTVAVSSGGALAPTFPVIQGSTPQLLASDNLGGGSGTNVAVQASFNVMLFNAATGKPLQSASGREVCNPCTIIPGANGAAPILGMPQLVQTAGGAPAAANFVGIVTPASGGGVAIADQAAHTTLSNSVVSINSFTGAPQVAVATPQGVAAPVAAFNTDSALAFGTNRAKQLGLSKTNARPDGNTFVVDVLDDNNTAVDRTVFDRSGNIVRQYVPLEGAMQAFGKDRVKQVPGGVNWGTSGGKVQILDANNTVIEETTFDANGHIVGQGAPLDGRMTTYAQDQVKKVPGAVNWGTSGGTVLIYGPNNVVLQQTTFNANGGIVSIGKPLDTVMSQFGATRVKQVPGGVNWGISGGKVQILDATNTVIEETSFDAGGHIVGQGVPLDGRMTTFAQDRVKQVPGAVNWGTSGGTVLIYGQNNIVLEQTTFNGQGNIVSQGVPTDTVIQQAAQKKLEEKGGATVAWHPNPDGTFTIEVRRDDGAMMDSTTVRADGLPVNAPRPAVSLDTKMSQFGQAQASNVPGGANWGTSGNKVQILDANNTVIQETTFDANGNIIGQGVPLDGRMTTFAKDRVKNVPGAVSWGTSGGTVLIYGPNNVVLEQTTFDGNGNITGQSVPVDTKMAQFGQSQVANVPGGVNWGTSGDKVQILDANNTVIQETTFNAAGDIVGQGVPLDGRMTTFAKDRVKNVPGAVSWGTSGGTVQIYGPNNVVLEQTTFDGNGNITGQSVPLDTKMMQFGQAQVPNVPGAVTYGTSGGTVQILGQNNIVLQETTFNAQGEVIGQKVPTPTIIAQFAERRRQAKPTGTATSTMPLSNGNYKVEVRDSSGALLDRVQVDPTGNVVNIPFPPEVTGVPAGR